MTPNTPDNEPGEALLACPFCQQAVTAIEIQGAGYSLVGCKDLNCPASSISCYPDEWNTRRAAVAAVEGDAQAKRNDYNMIAWQERFGCVSVMTPYSDEKPLRDVIKDADTVIRMLYKEVQSLRAAASAPLPAEPPERCEVPGCLICAAYGPATPAQPEGEQGQSK